MRSKIEANEYKDYILGFIFYKYLSDQENRWLKSQDYGDDDIKQYVNEDDPEIEKAEALSIVKTEDDKETISDALNETNDDFVTKNIPAMIKTLKADDPASPLIAGLQKAEKLSIPSRKS